ncbi:unnamed protein product, partial [Rotaria magnacalcarata]
YFEKNSNRIKLQSRCLSGYSSSPSTKSSNHLLTSKPHEKAYVRRRERNKR